MRTLLLLLLLAGSGLFVSAMTEHEAITCSACMFVVFKIKEIGRDYPKKKGHFFCRTYEQLYGEPGTGRLCRNILYEIASKDLYADIHDMDIDVEGFDLEGVPNLTKFCHTKLSKKYCPRSTFELGL
ncbi:hypothetical protein Aduo_001089 [Ancylostoma duodenale]